MTELIRRLIRAVDRRRGLPACRECGCTEHAACAGGCWWIEPDLCSTCDAAELEAYLLEIEAVGRL